MNEIHIPKPENMLPNVGYAFTVSPSNTFQYFSERENRIGKCVRIAYNKLNHSCIQYKLYIEVSRTGRIHYHGYIWIKDIREFFIDVVPILKDYAQIEIDTIEDDEVWEHYITKQCAIMQLKYICKMDYPVITCKTYSRNEGYF